MTREAQQVYSELAQFGKPRGPIFPYVDGSRHWHCGVPICDVM
jgi:hypothetical protein